MAAYPPIPYAVAATLVALFLVPRIVNAWVARSKLQHLPTIGPLGIFGSYIGAYNLLFDTHDMIQDGYDKYFGAAFKIPLISRWAIVITGPEMIEEVRMASDDELSFNEAISDSLQTDYTMERDIHLDPYHVRFVHVSLTRNLGVRIPDMQDEIATAFADLIPAKDEWIRVPAFNTGKQLVFRTTNRLFVGLPLCRDPDYRALNDEYSNALFKSAFIINLAPDFFKPIVARLLFFYVPAAIKRGLKQIGPLVEERLEKERQHGPHWPGKPDDLITWLIEKAPAHDRSVRALTIRVLAANFAALHSTSMAITHALYDLAAYPSHVPALREEVEAVINAEGLTKEAIDKMYKLDSFVKESLRLRGSARVNMPRKVVKDFTFSNGTVIPAGNTIVVAGYAMHHDEENYPNPEQFDGCRFSRMREAEEEKVKYQTVALGLDYVTFGNGRHACPGRFFAVAELKTMLAHVLLTYDVKLEQEGVRPADHWFTFTAMPNQTAGLMFRKRSS